MSLAYDARFLSIGIVACAATLVLARLAVRLGLGDDPRGPLAARKHQVRAVPTVGGAAILIAVGVSPWGRAAFEAGGVAVLAAFALVFLVGAIDDLHAAGLSPRVKFAAQALALAPVAFVGRGDGVPLDAVALWLAALAAVNVLNTFDNADGAAGAVASTGFACAGSWWLPAVLGFLPWNLFASRGRARGGAAYLGDSGAFVLGLALVTEPGAWGALCLPALDLARLSAVRLLAGSRPWLGDRRHLAHRLQRRGLPPLGVSLGLALAALPASIGASAASPAALGFGLAGTTALFLAALVLTRGCADAE